MSLSDRLRLQASPLLALQKGPGAVPGSQAGAGSASQQRAGAHVASPPVGGLDPAAAHSFHRAMAAMDGTDIEDDPGTDGQGESSWAAEREEQAAAKRAATRQCRCIWCPVVLVLSCCAVLGAGPAIYSRSMDDPEGWTQAQVSSISK